MVQVDVDGLEFEERYSDEDLQPIVEIPRIEDAVRALVANFGGKPMICQEQGKKAGKELEENLKRAKQLLQSKGVGLEHPLEDAALVQRAQEACSRNGPNPSLLVTPTKKGRAKGLQPK
jgi:hypothetical protein